MKHSVGKTFKRNELCRKISTNTIAITAVVASSLRMGEFKSIKNLREYAQQSFTVPG
ncbi:MAG: hypothetical protein JWP81_2008 [Ferruginibacter sp.]|nr:hypothetical protein [Ferruginibacter sp.]